MSSTHSAAPKVNVDVLYCGAWGYAAKFQQFAAQLNAEFPDTLVLSGEATPERTGYFEVKIMDKLVHSKNDGDGYVDSDAKFNKIVDAIDGVLDD